MSQYFSMDALRSAFPEYGDFRVIAENEKGAVFNVLSHKRGIRVALKLTADRGDPGTRERFEKEFRILFTNQQYEHLVKIYSDRGIRQISMHNGNVISHFFFTMQLCKSDLARALREHSLELCSRVIAILQMMDGLSFLHAKEIVHRDVKPGNLFIEQLPCDKAEFPQHPISIRIGDFDIARARLGMDSAGGRTATYHLMGTLYYLAPERWHDAPAYTDWRPSDQYAAGVTAFQILSQGHFPLDFRGVTDQSPIAYQQLHLSGKRLPLVIPERVVRGLPERFPRLERVLQKMFASYPEDRYPDILKAKLALLDALAVSRLWPCTHHVNHINEGLAARPSGG